MANQLDLYDPETIARIIAAAQALERDLARLTEKAMKPRKEAPK